MEYNGVIDTEDYLKVKALTYKAITEAYPEMDAKAVGVYWFTMSVDLLVGRFNMDKELMKTILDSYTYEGVDCTKDGETVH